jgi:hypothetical protein
MPDLLDDTVVDAGAVYADLVEAKYSAEQKRAMLGKGQAIKNDDGEPSYPIGDVEDLRKAISAVGRGGGSHNKIRAYIIRRAKALGKSDMIPDDWSTSGASKGATDEAARPQAIEENRPLTEAATGETGSRRRIQLIDAGWSRNARYYSQQVLAEAAAARIYPAGTPMYIDHPTATEKVERPERSVKDLAARLVTDARYEGGALIAEAELFGPWKPVINEIADQIGLSVRSNGTVEWGEAEGKQGQIVTQITEGISVDFVTAPARGGKVLELIESARATRQRELAEARNVCGWLEARLHTSFTGLADDMYGNGRLSRDERIGLSAAIGDALEAFTRRVQADHPQLTARDLWDEPDADDAQMSEAARLLRSSHRSAALRQTVREAYSGKGILTWVRGHGQGTDGARWVVFSLESASDSALYRQPYQVAEANGEVTLTGEPVEVVAVTTYESAGQAPEQEPPDPPNPTSEDAAATDAPGGKPADNTETEEGSMPELTDEQARELEEARDQANKANAERDTARTEAETARTELARFKAAELARPVAAQIIAESGLPAAAQTRILGQVVDAATVPLTDAHTLDEATFKTAVSEAVKAEQTYLASLAEAAGAGTVRGLGDTSGNGAGQPAGPDPKVTEALTESYIARGLSKEAARLAAAGRPL